MELFFLALLVAIMAVALGSGYPVAFALPGAAILTIGLAGLTGWFFEANPDAYFHSGGPRQWLSAGVTNLRGVYWEVERDTLIAIPLFIFMGIMLQRSKIAEDLLVTMAQLFGPVPGGLGISVVFVGALLAATTGIVGATVVAMGLISLPAMLRNNYSQSLATGTIAASGTLGQIIPPSIVLIILADQLASATDQAATERTNLYTEATGELSMPSVFAVSGTSAGEMFLGAFVPGILLVLIYMAYILLFAILRPKNAPAVPYDGVRDRAFWGRVALTLIPPLTLIFLVLGSILTGIATVNQAGAIGAAGALIMAGYRLVDNDGATFIPALLSLAGLAIVAFALSNYNMNVKAVVASGGDMTGIWIGASAVGMIMVGLVWSGIRVLRIENTMREVMVETAKTTSLVFIILLGAAMLTAAFRAFGGEDLVKEFLDSLPGGFWTQFIIVMAVIFLLGFFLDFIEIAVVVVPIVAPILLADPEANITAVWLGVMIGLNIQTSFLTPPFGFALFYLRGVAPAIVKTTQIYKGVIAFIGLQLTALAIVGFYPQLVNYLPNRVSLLSEQAPPPRNPQLQACLEEYVYAKISDDRSGVDAAVARARGLDLSILPRGIARDLDGAFDDADTALDTISEIFVAEAAVFDAAPAYRPVLRQVRGIEKQVRRLIEEAEELEQEARFIRDPAEDERKASLEAREAELRAEADALLATIPDEWDEQNGIFSELTRAEQTLRRTYRRAGDGAIEPIMEFLAILDATEPFTALEDALRALGADIADGDREELEDTARALSSQFGALAGADDVRSSLSRVRRNLRENREDREAAMENFEEALAAFEEQLGWRAAGESLRAPLTEYRAALLETVGSRQGDSLSRSQALYIAGCNAAHRDISLNF